MVIGIVSSIQSHVQLIKDTIATKYDFTHVTEKDIVSIIGIGKLVNGNKAPLLDYLQDTYKNVLISGDVLWSETLCQYLLNDLKGALLIDITLPKPGELPHGQYWKCEGIIDWVIRFQRRIPQHNNSRIVYVDIDNSQFQFNMTTLLDTIQCDTKRGAIDVSMEDVIKRAMEDLGIEPPPEQVIPPETPPMEESSTAPLPEVKDTDHVPQPVLASVEHHPTIVSDAIDKNQNLTTNNDSQVFLKIKDGTMVLFIPINAQLPTQVINDVEYHTLVFTAPDLGNTRLQPLKTVVVPRRAIVPPQVTNDSSNLQQLVAQKVQLDQSIKDARAIGDEATVNELRKQRRLIRRQINTIGGSVHVTTQD